MMSSNRLARFSQAMAVLTLCIIVAMLVCNALGWIFPTSSPAPGSHGMKFFMTDAWIARLGIDVGGFPWWQKAGGALLSSVPLLALANGLRHLRLLFRAYARREYFAPAAAVHLGKVGKWVAIWVVLGLVCEPLLSLWATMRALAGHRVVTLDLGSSDLVALFLAACIVVVAHILKQASELEAEHRQFV